MPAHAKLAWDSTLYFLDGLGFATEDYDGPITWHRLERRHGLRAPVWRGPHTFNETTHSEVWNEGALIDVQFGCPSFGHSVLAEDVPVNHTNTMADQSQDSWVYGNMEGVCLKCDETHEIVTTNTIGWWNLDLLCWNHRFREAGAKWDVCPEDGRLAPGKYLLEIVLDFSDRDDYVPPEFAGYQSEP
jgi:hypothetical protein